MYRDKFRKLGARSMRDDVADVAAAAVQLRDAVGEGLPETYLAILQDYRGAVVFERSVAYRPIQRSPFDRKDGTQGFEVLYGLGTGANSVIAALDTYRGRVPASALPIGEAPGGNQICLILSGTKRGQVFFWDHDHERQITGHDGNDFGNMYLIANDVEDFVARLGVQPEPSAGGGGIIESESWLDI